MNPNLLIRRLNLTVNQVVDEALLSKRQRPQQLDLFADTEEQRKRQEKEQAAAEKERRMQETQIALKRRFGKNAILKGLNFDEGATARERNQQIGGHKA